MYRFTLLLFAFLLGISAGAADFPADIILDVEGVDPGSVALYIEDIASREILCDYNGEKPLLPASTNKLVTTAAASLLYNQECRWPTTVELDGTRVDTTFYGNLIVTSYGDPTIGSARFSDVDLCGKIADSLRVMGITRVEGDVVVEHGGRVDSGAPAGWTADDLKENYGAVYRAVNYADNRFTLSLPERSTKPLVPDLKMSIANSRRGFAISKSPFENSLIIKMPGRRRNRSHSITCPNSNPEATLKAEIIAHLEQSGVSFGNNTGGPRIRRRELLLIHRSPTLGNVMRSLMVRSDNMLAESVQRLLAPGESAKEAIAVEKHILASAGVIPDERAGRIVIADGSGLSRDNRLNAYFLADVLLRMASSEDCIPFVGLFPRAGREGTVQALLADTRLEGHMALKSGSLNGVICYAGYMLDRESLPTHAVVVMINNFKGNRSRMRSAIGDFLLASFPERN